MYNQLRKKENVKSILSTTILTVTAQAHLLKLTQGYKFMVWLTLLLWRPVVNAPVLPCFHQIMGCDCTSTSNLHQMSDYTKPIRVAPLNSQLDTAGVRGHWWRALLTEERARQPSEACSWFQRGNQGKVEDEGQWERRWEIEVWKVKIIIILKRQTQQAVGAWVYKETFVGNMLDYTICLASTLCICLWLPMCV